MFPKPYVNYLVYFHAVRDYFECHEILEDHWKENERKDMIWVGLIQLAVGMYHFRNENLVGAKRQLIKAREIFRKHKTTVVELGLNSNSLINIVTETISKIEEVKPYKSVELPIIDKSLIQICEQRMKELGYSWGENDNSTNINLIKKHSLRNRKAIIDERENQLKRRKKG